MLDEKDRVILALLAKNARITLTSIAQAIRISDVATKKRLQKLESRGVIVGYRALVNPREVGYNAVALIGVNAEPGRVVEIAAALASRRDTTYVAITSGDHDVIAEVWARDSGELLSKIKEIESLSGVKDVCPAILVDTIKYHTSLPEEFLRKNLEGVERREGED